MSQTYPVLLTCATGLETLLRAEVESLALARGPILQELGRLRFDTDQQGMHRALIHLGLATSVELSLARIKALSFGELVNKVRRLPWTDWLIPGQAFDVRARARKSKLYHTGGIEERVAQGMLAVLGEPGDLPDEDEMDLLPRVQVRFERDVAELSLDLAGRPLHQRGYRLDPGQAPLREDLARALILSSGWDHQTTLLDPFCGSGTILIEAALLARQRAPGLSRAHALEQSALYDPGLMSTLRLQAKAEARESCTAPLLGSDRDERALAACRANAERAGVLEDLTLHQAPLAEAPLLGHPEEAPAQGYLVSNPPLGQRLGGKKLVHLYQSLGERFQALPAGWRLSLVSSDSRLTRKVGIPLESRARVSHGGLSVQYLCSQP